MQTVGSRPVTEYEMFKAGTEMTRAIDAINHRLGLSHSARLGFGEANVKLA